MMRHMWFCAANIDNRWGPTTPLPARKPVAYLTAMLASTIQPAIAMEIERWPACPAHPDHALELQAPVGPSGMAMSIGRLAQRRRWNLARADVENLRRASCSAFRTSSCGRTEAR